MESDDSHILRRPEFAGKNVHPEVSIADDGRWNKKEWFFFFGMTIATISGLSILDTIFLKGDMEDHPWIVLFTLKGLTVIGGIGCCVCFLYRSQGQSHTTVRSKDVTAADRMPSRTPLEVHSKEATVEPRSSSHVLKPSQAHITDPDEVPGPSGLQHPDADVSSERSRSHSGSTEDTSESESPPRGERYAVLEASATRPSRASWMTQAAASVARNTEESVRRTGDIAAINEPGGSRQCSRIEGPGTRRGRGRGSRTLRQRKSVPDRTFSCDREDGGA